VFGLLNVGLYNLTGRWEDFKFKVVLQCRGLVKNWKLVGFKFGTLPLTWKMAGVSPVDFNFEASSLPWNVALF
jgi:hypothetical protein